MLLRWYMLTQLLRDPKQRTRHELDVPLHYYTLDGRNVRTIQAKNEKQKLSQPNRLLISQPASYCRPYCILYFDSKSLDLYYVLSARQICTCLHQARMHYLHKAYVIAT